MRNQLLLIAAIVLVVVTGLAVKTALHRSNPDEPHSGPCQRIVSLSPSTTEVLFALGLGDRVVGVTQFCKYPPEAQTRAIVGGYLNPNYEAILALKPGLVVLRGENEQYVTGFRELGLETLVVRHQTVEGILDSMTTIGRKCGAEDRAARLVEQIQGQMRRLEEKTAGLERPKLMIVAERALGVGRIQNVYVAGGDGFLNRMIELAGARNACATTAVGFPVVSAEGILKMDPEVIVDLIAQRQQEGHTKEELLADWEQLDDVPAVRNGRVHVVDDDYAFIPGPRFVLLAEKLARLAHPEVKW